MATSKKIEEKYQKLLKEIQKRPENKMCFDCNSRGNQYVVLTLNTFCLLYTSPSPRDRG